MAMETESDLLLRYKPSDGEEVRTAIVKRKRLKIIYITIVVFLVICLAIVAGVILYLDVYKDGSSSNGHPTPNRPDLYNYTFSKQFIKMSDGVHIAITLITPIASANYSTEKFPVLLEYMPYRKDGGSYIRDWELYDYFGKYGFIVCRADIRGTGGSEGARPNREYSDIEMTDGQEIIEWLSQKYEFSNGNVGMYGISWSAINSLILVMKHTKHLKAIMVFHASHDLYYNDVHYIDGVRHLDDYEIGIDHANSLPSTSNDPWVIDDAYLNNRFYQKPWMSVYNEHNNDSDWWRDRSIKYHFDDLVKSNVPIYLWCGQLDGYRDYAYDVFMNLSQQKHSPLVKLVVGPWDHEMTSRQSFDIAAISPRVEWKSEAKKWFNVWLRNEHDRGNKIVIDQPDVTIYVRKYYPPNPADSFIPGQWRTYNAWPETFDYKLYLTDNYALSTTNNEENISHSLEYNAIVGTEIPIWWGSLTGNMVNYDQNGYSALVYDSNILTNMIEIIGKVNISLFVSSNVRLTNWIVRLEDFNPETNESSLVTGANRKSSDIISAATRFKPKFIEIGKWYQISFELHLTTWQFPIGHIIRIAISNALYPMLWPSKYANQTVKVMVNHAMSFVQLPVSNIHISSNNDDISYFNSSKLSLGTPAFLNETIQVHFPEDACYYVLYTSDDYIEYINDTEIHIHNQYGYYQFIETYVQHTDIEYEYILNQLNPELNVLQSTLKTIIIFNLSYPGIRTPLNQSTNTPLCVGPPPLINRLNPDDDTWITLETHTIMSSDMDNFYVSVDKRVSQNDVFQAQMLFNDSVNRGFQ